MLKYAKGLKFDEVPDYEWLRSLFSDLFNTLNYKLSQALDWIKDRSSTNNNDGYEDDDGEEEDDKPVSGNK